MPLFLDLIIVFLIMQPQISVLKHLPYHLILHNPRFIHTLQLSNHPLFLQFRRGQTFRIYLKQVVVEPRVHIREERLKIPRRCISLLLLFAHFLEFPGRTVTDSQVIVPPPW